jgi:hypothetical protein
VLWGIVPLAVSTRDTVVLGRVALLIVGLALYPMPWGEGFSVGVVWGVLGAAIGVLVLQAVRLGQVDDTSAVARAARLQVQAP